MDDCYARAVKIALASNHAAVLAALAASLRAAPDVRKDTERLKAAVGGALVKRNA